MGSASSTNSLPKLHDAAMPAVIRIATNSTWPAVPGCQEWLVVGVDEPGLGLGKELLRRPMSDRLVREEAERPSLRDSLRAARHSESTEDAVGV